MNNKPTPKELWWLKTYTDIDQYVAQCKNDDDLWLLAQSIVDDAWDSAGAILDSHKVYYALISGKT